MDIIDEMAEARNDAFYSGVECNTVLIPETRRHEVEKIIADSPALWMQFCKDRKIKCFGCDVIFSHSIDEIKAGYIV